MLDSNYSINTIGVKLDESLEHYVQSLVFNILEYSPYDSFLKVNIQSKNENFVVNLTVKYQDEVFFGLGEENSAEGALEAAERSLYSQIKVWRERRFLAHPEGKSSLNVMVVDDDMFSIKILESCLLKFECNLIKVQSGKEAVYHIQRKKIDLIVMDWEMLPINGRATLKLIDSQIAVNKSPERNKIPVIVYTINKKEKINFPRTENLYQVAYLSKESSVNDSFKLLERVLMSFKKHWSEKKPITVSV